MDSKTVVGNAFDRLNKLLTSRYSVSGHQFLVRTWHCISLYLCVKLLISVNCPGYILHVRFFERKSPSTSIITELLPSRPSKSSRNAVRSEFIVFLMIWSNKCMETFYKDGKELITNFDFHVHEPQKTWTSGNSFGHFKRPKLKTKIIALEKAELFQNLPKTFLSVH